MDSLPTNMNRLWDHRYIITFHKDVIPTEVQTHGDQFIARTPAELRDKTHYAVPEETHFG